MSPSLGRPLAREDLDHVLHNLAGSWEHFRDARIFMTGATGIIGKWLIETVLHANRELDLRLSIVALTRDVGRFAFDTAHIAGAPELELIQGDVRNLPKVGASFDFIVHGATDVVGSSEPLDLFDSALEGTRQVVRMALATGVRDLLLLSSGAVYGPQPPNMERIAESYFGGPDPLATGSAYGEGKRAAEWVAAALARDKGLRLKVARPFTVVGPYLPLNRHFAIGNFIADGLASRPIRISGDGTTIRSYLHLADVAIWLWTILLNGRNCVAYNVGSEQGRPLIDFAERIASLLGSDAGVQRESQPAVDKLPQRYVPDTARARAELGLAQSIDFDEAILRTAHWHQGANSG